MSAAPILSLFAGLENNKLEVGMKTSKSLRALALATFLGVIVPGMALAAQSKPNIVFIMGDDIGMWNIGAYHRGLMAGPTSSQASCRSALV